MYLQSKLHSPRKCFDQKYILDMTGNIYDVQFYYINDGILILTQKRNYIH